MWGEYGRGEDVNMQIGGIEHTQLHHWLCFSQLCYVTTIQSMQSQHAYRGHTIVSLAALYLYSHIYFIETVFPGSRNSQTVFPKQYFPNSISQTVFPKPYFPNCTFPKLYFQKAYFLKDYFPEAFSQLCKFCTLYDL